MTTRTLTNCTFNISDFDKVKQKVLNWAQRFNTFCFLDNHQYSTEPHTVECLLAAGVKRQLKAEPGNALEQLQRFIADVPLSVRDSLPRQGGGQTRGWLFGHLSYDLKNEIEELSSSHIDLIDFPDLFFFEPEVLIRLNKNEMKIEADDAGKIYDEIYNENPLPAAPTQKRIC